MFDKQDQIAALVTDVLKFYRQDVTKFTLQVWANAMRPFDFDDVSRAFEKHVANPDGGQFAPKPADIVKALQGTAGDRAALAWGKVLEAISGVGAYSDVVFDDAAIHAALEDLGGWPKVCRTKTDDLSYLQHRFALTHKAYTERGTFDYPRRLAGDRSPDDEYTKLGLKPPRPAVVGDLEAARRVHSGGGAGKTQITFAPVHMLLTSEVKA